MWRNISFHVMMSMYKLACQPASPGLSWSEAPVPISLCSQSRWLAAQLTELKANNSNKLQLLLRYAAPNWIEYVADRWPIPHLKINLTLTNNCMWIPYIVSVAFSRWKIWWPGIVMERLFLNDANDLFAILVQQCLVTSGLTCTSIATRLLWATISRFIGLALLGGRFASS